MGGVVEIGASMAAKVTNRGRRNRQRGQEGEREVCALLADAIGQTVTRRLGQERDSGTDIHLGPFAIEVKRRKAIAGLYEWLGQAQEAATASGLKYGCVVLRADGKPFLVVHSFDDWITLARGEL